MCYRQIQRDTGWTAVSLQYPSTRQPIIQLAEGVATEVQDLVLKGEHTSVWAVTHSLGGIVQRHIMGLPDHGTQHAVTMTHFAVPCNRSQHWLTACAFTSYVYQLCTYMLFIQSVT